MTKYRLNIVLLLLLFNTNVIILTMHMNTSPTLQTHLVHEITDESIGKNVPVSEDTFFTQSDQVSRFSIQQDNVTNILSKNIDNDNEAFTFVNNIWNDSLGSDPLVLSDPTLYENGTIYPTDEDFDSESLFVRIGNGGYLNDTLNENISEGISAGWQLDFPVSQDYDQINISFKWRFDVYDPPAFDNFSELVPGVVIEGSPDYQEIRCNIAFPDDQTYFWLGNPSTLHNPNGSVFYRVGPSVIYDEQWFSFTGSFHVPRNDLANYTLELGTYLNTREYWNEYFDVWFDDIEIIGITDVTDNSPPEPTDVGLQRTADVSMYNFWAHFSEGTWESSIKNVTVFYNRSGSVNIQTNTSLEYQINTNITSAGYNQTYWQKSVGVNVSDILSYKFVIFDGTGNSFTTGVYSETIGDYTPPVIISELDPTNADFVHFFGNGTVILSINASDWGFGVEEAILNYTLNGLQSQSVPMTNKSTMGNVTLFQVKLEVGYESNLQFNILLSDTQGNSKSYSGFSTISSMDIVIPEIQINQIIPSTIEEGHVFVTTSATDPFGDIDRVFLAARFANGSLVITNDPDGSGLIDYSSVQLSRNSLTGLFEVRSTPSTPGGALKLPYTYGDLNTYSINVTVLDKQGNTNSATQIIVLEDTVAPKVQIRESKYSIPGQLNIWVQAVDGGSGIAEVTLEKRKGSGWGEPITLDLDEDGGIYFIRLSTSVIGGERIEFRINAIDNDGNSISSENRPIDAHITRIFVSTAIGLFITETIITTIIISLFAAIKITQRRRLRTVRRRRFDVALRGGERLAYLGEEAMFGFVAAYGQGEGITSTLLWEPSLIGHFYQYLKELVDRANNTVDFVMQTRAEDMVTYVDFTIEEISCSAITFAYPVASLPQKWVSTLSLEHTPETPRQGVLFMMLLMREKWTEVSHNFQEEIKEGMQDIKNYIIAGEDKEIINQKIQEFRLFISGTVEILEEIETDMDDVTDSIMGDFESEFLDDSDKE
ncbi:hypothetical protein CEE45_02435 [Candidatus Heimdallarchaeota archaeon B3_Heim]|nr:MAG: hypothetical protein CEE45_02435 [Candidatus Heimdallarchaeota archaeon B3_Heim]